MRKYLIAVSVLGMLGAGLSVSAEVDLSVLPGEVRSKVEAAIKEGAQTNPLKEYIDTSKKTAAAYIKEAAKVVKENPYLSDNATQKGITETLAEVSKSMEGTLATIDSNAPTVAGDLNGMKNLFEQLEDLAFPYACQNYKTPNGTGYVKAMTAKRPIEYALYASQDSIDKGPIAYMFKVGSDLRVGTLGKDADYNVPQAVNSEVEVYTLDIDGQKKVVCIGGYIKKATDLK